MLELIFSIALPVPDVSKMGLSAKPYFYNVGPKKKFPFIEIMLLGNPFVGLEQKDVNT